MEKFKEGPRHHEKFSLKLHTHEYFLHPLPFHLVLHSVAPPYLKCTNIILNYLNVLKQMNIFPFSEIFISLTPSLFFLVLYPTLLSIEKLRRAKGWEVIFNWQQKRLFKLKLVSLPLLPSHSLFFLSYLFLLYIYYLNI